MLLHLLVGMHERLWKCTTVQFAAITGNLVAGILRMVPARGMPISRPGHLRSPEGGDREHLPELEPVLTLRPSMLRIPVHPDDFVRTKKVPCSAIILLRMMEPKYARRTCSSRQSAAPASEGCG